MSDRVIIFDTSLRDGEQAPGATMNLREKTRLAEQLEILGVDVIEAGFPASSQTDFESVQAVAAQVKDCQIAVLNRIVPGLESVCFSSDHALGGRLAARGPIAPIRPRTVSTSYCKASWMLACRFFTGRSPISPAAIISRACRTRG